MKEKELLSAKERAKNKKVLKEMLQKQYESGSITVRTMGDNRVVLTVGAEDLALIISAVSLVTDVATKKRDAQMTRLYSILSLRLTEAIIKSNMPEGIIQ